ncbi:MAG: acyltransferase [Bdellovibrionales bacterium]
MPIQTNLNQSKGAALGNTQHFLYLDGLRGLAALVIAFVHFRDFAFYKLPVAGGLWVGFFFMLSGFVLTHAYRKQIQKRSLTFRSYVGLRLARLYPLYILTNVLCFLMVAAGAYYKFKTGAAPSFDVFKGGGVVEILETITLTQMLFGGHQFFNGPSWSISVEMWCSLWAFFLFMPRRKWIKGLAISAVVILFVLVQLNGGAIYPKTQWICGIFKQHYVTGLFCFTAGWLAALVVPVHSGKIVPGIIATLGALCVTVFVKSISSNPFCEIGFYGISLIMICCFATTSTPANNVLRLILKKSGEYSYGFYLWHMFIIMLVPKLLRVTEKAGIELERTIPLAVVFVLVTITVSHFSYKYFEIPAKKFLRNRLAAR